MDNQHRQIKGYRELNRAEIELMNKIKNFGPRLEILVREVEEFNRAMWMEAHNRTESGDQTQEQVRVATEVLANHAHAQPARWAAMAKTEFQMGLMYLTRAVVKPEFF
jgi:hypothetical protein